MKVNVTLRNPLDRLDLLTYSIVVDDHELARDWIAALKLLLQSNRPIEKNFCFIGFPKTARNLDYLCAEMTAAIKTINTSDLDYTITDQFTRDTVLAEDWAANGPNHDLFNSIHNHFERLQGTVEAMSTYYNRADYETKYAIRQLNILCHEMESLILGLRQAERAPEWVRPSQITTWLAAERYPLKDIHRQGFVTNGYDRVIGGVYMHWAQIGKTLFEVFRDEAAPELTETVCEAITELKYYSGEFDIEWGRSVCTDDARLTWHHEQQQAFKQWLIANDLDPNDPMLSLGYLPIGQVDLLGSFGTEDPAEIWDQLSSHLDILSIEVDGVQQTYDYCWTDDNYKQRQIDSLKPGYDYARNSSSS